MGFSDKIVLEEGGIVFFHNGVLDTGKPYYLYLAVHGTKLADYKQCIDRPSPPSLKELQRLGIILAFDEGTPSREVVSRLEREYGVHTPQGAFP